MAPVPFHSWHRRLFKTSSVKSLVAGRADDDKDTYYVSGLCN